MILAALMLLAAPHAMPGEEPVDPYEVSDANAGARPFAGDALYRAFHGAEGVDRIVDDFIGRCLSDPRISEVFKSHDMVRLDRTLTEQFCYLLGGGCPYTGRDMKAAHKDMGLQVADMNALVDNLQQSMAKEGVPFRAQNRFLAKLAPMKRQVVER